MIEFKITEESIEKIDYIIDNMEGKSFHNHYHIIYDIITSIESESVTYVEIGSYAGASISLMSSHPKVKKAYSLDIGNPIPKEVPIRNVNFFKNDQCKYSYIEGDSLKKCIIDKVNSEILEASVIFIDGDHSYDAVISDFNNYANLVKSGGYIIFDDYMDHRHSPEVRPAVDDIVKNLDTSEYDIIGSLEYELLYKTNRPNLSRSNVFIIKKK